MPQKEIDDDEGDHRRRKPKSKMPVWLWVTITLGILFSCGGGLDMLLTSVQKVRSAAQRSKQMGNMCGIGVGLHTQDDTNGYLAVPFAWDDDKQPNPGLSWRVGVLPYIGREALYVQFDRSKSWDSPRNQPFSTLQVSTLMWPEVTGSDTRLFGFNGPGALMEANVKPPLTFARIPDGLSNTAMVAEVTIGAPWASPMDVPYTRNGPLPSFGAAGNDSFLLLMADGSVRNVKKNIPPAIMHALIQIDDGQVINLDGF